MDKIRPFLDKKLQAFHNEYIHEMLIAKGSSHNHQVWVGGYYDHLLQCLILAQDLYKSLSPKGALDFSFSSVVYVLYFHDIEKIFKYGSKPEEINKDEWYTEILPKNYNIHFSDQEFNALKYIHGEGSDYKKDERVSGSLAGFCHAIDVISSRVLHNLRGTNFDFNLRDVCKSSVGESVRFFGINGDEHSESHGEYVEGEGFCISQHDSHGLCLMIETKDETLCVDPILLEILQ